MAPNWNSDQLKAIDGRNGTMLVSAAAGSGKTAVLVERVIRRLCDTEKPCGIENLLIVTFTRAAAAQMKDKILDALTKKSAEFPEDKNLRRNRFMLPYANICTIDSFCINLVRDNFFSLDISPDFAILDEGKRTLLENQALMTVINRFHEEKSEDFAVLNLLLNSNKNDNNIMEIIRTLYTLSRAYVFPEEWLLDLYREYENPFSPCDSPWGRRIITTAEDYIEKTIAQIDYCLQCLEDEPELEEKYRPIFLQDKAYFSELLLVLGGDNWDEIYRLAGDHKFNNPTVRNYESKLKDYCHNVRCYARKSDTGYYKKNFAGFSIQEADYYESMKVISPAVKTLVDATIDYSNELYRLKNEENAYDFNDTLHFALDLLVKNENGVPVRTELAKELSSTFEEILVDEYQDVSKAQDTVFLALSKDDTNRFMVGDIKQSIYSFRQALPDVFRDLRKSMCDYDGLNYPARVDLSTNYRSRKGVTDTVNFIFSQIMTEYAGGVDYNSREYLNAGAAYPEKEDADTEIYLLRCEKDTFLEKQAEFAARYVKNAVDSGLEITRNGEKVKASYGDFCILSRAPSGIVRTFSDAFDKLGIPFTAELDNPFLVSPEVSFLISLLTVIDNPINDVPLTAVLLSPVFGFTPDDLSQLRIDDRKDNIYRCLVKASEKGNEKCRRFLEKLEELRCIAVTMPAGEFTSRIIDETGYRAIVSAMNNSDIRLANINLFINTANRYEQTGVKGISAFVRFLDKMTNKEKLKPSGGSPDSPDSVKLISIHKSKGLEYPVVFLVNCEKKHNDMDSAKSVIVSRKCGIGFRMISDSVSYETLPHLAAKIDKTIESHSEELRVLYVALTRPKEKLIILASSQDWEKNLKKYAGNVIQGQKPYPSSVLGMTTYAEYILTALMKHPDAHALRIAAGIETEVHESCDSKIRFEIVNTCKEEEKEKIEVTGEKPAEYSVDPELLKELTARLDYVYPYSELNGVTAKRIASDAEKENFNKEYFASDKPAFTSKTRLTPAQRGTAIHRFMQYSDYSRASVSPAEELKRLEAEGMLTHLEAEAVDEKLIAKFFTTALAKRILSAEKVYKEYPFITSLPLSEVHPEIPADKAEGEVVIIEGVVDCAFVEKGKLVIVDYKTDRAQNAEELKEKYSGQLSIYRKCLSEALKMDVYETVIYSFRLGEEIVI